MFKAAYNLSFATWEVLICRGAKTQIANEDGFTPKSIAMKQIGAGPFRFGPESDEVLNQIQPKSDAERHFIQWLKNECPPNCRKLMLKFFFSFSSTNRFLFLFVLDLEATATKKEPVRKKPVVNKKKVNYISHYPQNVSHPMTNLSHPTAVAAPPPPYTISACYQQTYYGQYPVSTPSYSHVEHFQPSPPSSSQCELTEQDIYFPLSYPSFSL